jgi:uncharacterized protein (DUF111 family)
VLGERVTSFSPEYESCKLAAETHGIPIKEVYEAARRIATES